MQLKRRFESHTDQVLMQYIFLPVCGLHYGLGSLPSHSVSLSINQYLGIIEAIVISYDKNINVKCALKTSISHECQAARDEEYFM